MTMEPIGVRGARNRVDARRHYLDQQIAASRAALAALRDAVRAAHAAGVPIAHIAHDAGVTRQTVYRWIKDDA